MASHLLFHHCMSDSTLLEGIRNKFKRLRPLLSRAPAAAMGRLRNPDLAPRWRHRGCPSHGPVADHDLGRTQGTPAPAARPPEEIQPERVRAFGGGRHLVEDDDTTLLRDLETLVDATTRGDPPSPLRWTCKSTRNLAEELRRQGHRVSHLTVAALLHDLDYSLQANRKTREGQDHPDRDAQFEHINRQVRAFQRQGQPVVSVDTKKKELVGDFKNPGREWRRRGHPEEVARQGLPGQAAGQSHSRRGLRSDATTRAGSAWASITTRPSSLRKASGAGGKRWGGRSIRGPRNC